MRILTFGLGGTKAEFLRLGFGSIAAAQADTVHGGFRQWRPAVVTPPILLDVVEHVCINLVVRPGGTSLVSQAARSRAQFRVRASGDSASSRMTRGAASVMVRAAGTQATRRNVPGRTELRARGNGATSACVGHGGTSRLQFAARSHTAFARSDRARLKFNVRAGATIERVTRSAHASRARLFISARSFCTASTQVDRVAAQDRRDMDLLNMLTREL